MVPSESFQGRAKRRRWHSDSQRRGGVIKAHPEESFCRSLCRCGAEQVRKPPSRGTSGKSEATPGQPLPSLRIRHDFECIKHVFTRVCKTLFDTISVEINNIVVQIVHLRY